MPNPDPDALLSAFSDEGDAEIPPRTARAGGSRGSPPPRCCWNARTGSARRKQRRDEEVDQAALGLDREVTQMSEAELDAALELYFVRPAQADVEREIQERVSAH